MGPYQNLCKGRPPSELWSFWLGMTPLRFLIWHEFLLAGLSRGCSLRTLLFFCGGLMMRRVPHNSWCAGALRLALFWGHRGVVRSRLHQKLFPDSHASPMEPVPGGHQRQFSSRHLSQEIRLTVLFAGVGALVPHAVWNSYSLRWSIQSACQVLMHMGGL